MNNLNNLNNLNKKSTKKNNKLPLAVMSSATIVSMFSMNPNLVFGSDGVTNLVLGKAGYQVETDFKITGVKESSLKESIKNKLDIQDVQVIEITKNYEARTSIKIKLGEDKAGKEYIVAYVVGIETKESELKIVEEKIKTGKEGGINFVTDHKSYFILIPYSEENLLKLKQDGLEVVTETEPNLSFSDPNSNMTLEDERINNNINNLENQHSVFEYEYDDENNTATVTGVTDKGIMSVTVPEAIVENGKEYRVTKIGKKTFSGCILLKEVEIPGNIKKIESDAFYKCINLVKVTILDGVEEIEEGTFSGCSKLKEVKMYDSIKKVGSRAFFGCGSLESIIIPRGVEEIEESTFSGCSKLKEVIMFDDIKKIRSRAFSECSGLENITIPRGVEEIEECAFYSCSGLTKLNILGNIKKIGKEAFYDCNSLRQVQIPDSIEYIGENAFWDVKAKIILPEGKDLYTDKEYTNKYSTDDISYGPECNIYLKASNNLSNNNGDYGLQRLEQLKPSNNLDNNEDVINYRLKQDGSVKVIGVKDMKVTTVNIPETIVMNGKECRVTEIAQKAFFGYSSLETITIPSSVKMIGNKAFSECNNLKTITIPSSIETIEKEAFWGCDAEIILLAYKKLYIDEKGLEEYKGRLKKGPKSTVYLKDYKDDEGSDGVLNYKINENDPETARVTSVRDKTATTITIPETVVIAGEKRRVTGIAWKAFYECSRSTTIIISNSIRKIEYDAFLNCEAEIKVADGKRLYTDENFVKEYKGKLPKGPIQDVYLKYDVSDSILEYKIDKENPKIATVVGVKDTTVRTITIPATVFIDGKERKVTGIKERVFYRHRGLETIIIPNSVEKIGDDAFCECINLTEVIINPSSNTSSSVRTIGNGAFYGCTSLTKIDIQNSFETIGTSAFGGCTKLKEMKSNSVELIGMNAFEGCVELTDVEILGKTNIGYAAFNGCRKLSAVKMEGVESIGSHVFRGCSSLTRINIPVSIKEISREAFLDCKADIILHPQALYTDRARTSIYTGELKNGPEQDVYVGYVLDYTFDLKNKTAKVKECLDKNIKNINIPEKVVDQNGVEYTVVEICGNAFNGCGSLETVIINSAKTIEVFAFAGCNNLKTITIPSNIEKIGSFVFVKCNNLKTITIPDSVKEISNNAFKGCAANIILPVGKKLYIDKKCTQEYKVIQGLDPLQNGPTQDIYLGYDFNWVYMDDGNKQLITINYRNNQAYINGKEAKLNDMIGKQIWIPRVDKQTDKFVGYIEGQYGSDGNLYIKIKEGQWMRAMLVNNEWVVDSNNSTGIYYRFINDKWVPHKWTNDGWVNI